MSGKKSEADWAVAILQEKQEPMFFKDLIKEIIEKMGKEYNLVNLTSIFTRLNLDNRLVYEKDGYWFYDHNRVTREG